MPTTPRSCTRTWHCPDLSWKTTGDVALIRDAVNTAAARNAVVVASAGNYPERENQPHYPSDYPVVISTAAVRPDGKRTSYSYYGAEVDISAPGGATNPPEDRIYSAKPRG